MSSTIVSGQHDLTIEITPFTTHIDAPFFNVMVYKGENGEYADSYQNVYIGGYVFHRDTGRGLGLTVKEWEWVRSKYERVLETQLAYLRGELNDA